MRFIPRKIRRAVRVGTNMARRIRSSLKLKLILMVVLVIGVAVGAAPRSTIRMQKRQLLRESQEHLSAVLVLVHSVLTASMMAGDPEEVQRLVEMVGKDNDISMIRIFTVDHVIRFSSNPEERGLRLQETELPSYRGLAEPIVINPNARVEGHTLLQPIFNEQGCQSCHGTERKVLGVLEIGLSLDHVLNQISDLRRTATVATVVGLGIIALGMFLSFRYFVDWPLQDIVTAMEKAESGELSVRVRLHSNDELGRVGRQFNQMLSRLEAAQGELESYHEQQLARADRLATIGEMAAALAHEIRNPLTGLTGALSVLSRDYPSNDPRHEIVHESHLLIDRLNKSVEDVLRYARPSPARMRPVKLDDVVDRGMTLLEIEAKKASVTLVRQTIDYDTSDAPSINADPQQLQQVLINLGLNAIHATPKGGRIVLRTMLADKNGSSRFAVAEIEDCGKGMTSEEIDKAFHPFFSSKAQGTGLGLSIAKRIVEGHQGTITLDSTLGRGTRVRVELPVQPENPIGGT